MKKNFLALCMCMCICTVGTMGCGNTSQTKPEKTSETSEASDESQTETTPAPVNENPTINCWGDSLTAGTAFSNKTSYPKALQKLLTAEYTVNNFGIGGENSATIAERMGALPLTVGNTEDDKQSFTIPAETEESTPFSVVGTSGDSAQILKQVQEDTHEDCLNPVTINGIEGTLKKSGNLFVFTRTEKGEAVDVSSGDQITTAASQGDYSNDINIIWAGTNDYTSSENVDEVIGNIQTMIEYLKSDKYIVIGMTALTNMPEIEEVNDRLAEAFGDHFYDYRAYVLQEGLKAAGLKPTKQDKKDLKKGDIPTSFIKAPEYDHVHGNEKFYKLLAKQLYHKLQQLEYIE